MTAPQAPVLGATAVSTSEIDLSWNKPTDNVATTGYQVFRDGGPNPIATALAEGVAADAQGNVYAAGVRTKMLHKFAK